MLKRLFHEPEPEHVAHTLYSAYMVTQKILLGQLEFLTEDSFHFSTKVVEAHKKWPEAREPNQAPFNIDRNTELPRYVYLAQPENAVQMARFHNMLEFARLERATDVKFVPLAYKWQDVDTLVDIGGGTGHVAVTLAKAFPQLNIIVEDQAKSIAEAKSTLPVELQDRIRLVESDFTRRRRCVRVIEPLLPSIRAGAKLLIMDMMVPPPGTVPETMELWMRGLDMEMMIQFNSRVRSQEDWQNLLAGTSQVLVIKSTNTPDGSGLTVMEVGYEN
ncbi:cercosporin toxin biosynthesis protein [Metarhizium guizhouense ARSEF 977]|uniref:Cercosporin toxin biosynthesis protein n=1 Tax=Metarhizium guizhouense (strain ARSEF 977) TaxID=1276136 RepID=A0A0B4GYT4_METGA|nr:cercosporin toxin biosynthesis protein [Metarhizium guizhouense ARSEF 977]